MSKANKGTLLKSWVEVHALDSNKDTVKVINNDLKPENGSYLKAFEKCLDKIEPLYYAIAFVTFRSHTSGTYFSTREIRYK